MQFVISAGFESEVFGWFARGKVGEVKGDIAFIAFDLRCYTRNTKDKSELKRGIFPLVGGDFVALLSFPCKSS